MTDQGKTVLAGLRRVRKLYRDIALLLKTAEADFGDMGWEPMEARNTAFTGNSATIYSPNWWAPQFAARLLTNKDHPKLVLFVTVLLDCVRDESKIKEPVVAAGWMEFVGKPSWDDVPWYAEMHPENPKRADDGTIMRVGAEEFPEAWKDYRKSIRSIISLAVPLVRVVDSDTLHKAVVEPVLGTLT